MSFLSLSVAEAAEYLGVSPRSIWKWKYARKIPSYNIGKLVKFKQSDLDDFAESGFTPARTT
jgi:excisionase family DNA binding protein